jgi:N-acetylmuramidase
MRRARQVAISSPAEPIALSIPLIIIKLVPKIDLTDDELAAVTAAIRRAIETDSFPRAPRLDTLGSALAKLDLATAPKQTPHPKTPPPVNKTLTDEDFARAAKELNVEVAAIRAVAEVEAAGAGFLADGRPAVLFEAHIFRKHCQGKHHDMVDRKGVPLSSAKWNQQLYGATGAHQHNRLEDAAKADWDAAHKAASWGTFQILGENHAAVGHPTIKGFVDAMYSGAPAHLDAFVGFIKTNKLDGALRAKNWASFARGYNGPGYAANKYDTKMAAAYARWKKKG